jgi:hypothetical protein
METSKEYKILLHQLIYKPFLSFLKLFNAIKTYCKTIYLVIAKPIKLYNHNQQILSASKLTILSLKMIMIAVSLFFLFNTLSPNDNTLDDSLRNMLTIFVELMYFILCLLSVLFIILLSWIWDKIDYNNKIDMDNIFKSLIYIFNVVCLCGTFSILFDCLPTFISYIVIFFPIYFFYRIRRIFIYSRLKKFVIFAIMYLILSLVFMFDLFIFNSIRML